jgi:hypothetical protein
MVQSNLKMHYQSQSGAATYLTPIRVSCYVPGTHPDGKGELSAS